jgi:hypothetical protein
LTSPSAWKFRKGPCHVRLELSVIDVGETVLSWTMRTISALDELVLMGREKEVVGW